jgi:hypothetical protein
VWKVLGWLGNTAFFSRFLVQWYATEKKKEKRQKISHGRTRNFTEKDRNRNTEKKAKEKAI